MKNKILSFFVMSTIFASLSSSVFAVDFLAEVEPTPVDVHKDFRFYVRTVDVSDFDDSVAERLGHNSLTFEISDFVTKESVYKADLNVPSNLYTQKKIGSDGMNITLKLDRDKEPDDDHVYVPGGVYKFTIGEMINGEFRDALASAIFEVNFEPFSLDLSSEEVEVGDEIYFYVKDVNGDPIHLYEGWNIFVSHVDPFYNYGSTVNRSIKLVEESEETDVKPGTFKFLVPEELGLYKVDIRLPESEDVIFETNFTVVEPKEEEPVPEEEVDDQELPEEDVVAEKPKVNPFVDTLGHWSREYVSDLYSAGYVSGYDAIHFGPDNEITRAEFTKLAVNTFDLELPDLSSLSSIAFSDVPAPAWYLSYLVAAKNAGIVGGYNDGTFRPEAPVNRAEAVTILLKAAGIEPEQSYNTVFPDVAPLVWFGKYVNYAAENKIIGGFEDGTFGPEKNLTRAQAAKLFSLVKKL